jgi:CheY-like chemotaxis protein
VTITTGNVDVDAQEAARHGNAVVPGPYVRLTVADTGVGMTDEVREQVFEPFFTTKEAGRGTGLGLASVYAVVAEHGGSIRVESRPGEGAVFDLLLPRVADVAPRAEPCCPEAAAGGAESILLVEDDRWVRILLADLLSAQGYDVVEASGGLEALRIAAEHGTPFALLVTDAVMPGMNGLELAERAREEGIADRVLFVSGYETAALAGRGIDAGFNILRKPFTPEELAREVRAALDGVVPLAGSSRSETLGA